MAVNIHDLWVAPVAAEAVASNVVAIDQVRKSKATQESLASAAQKVEGLQTTVRIDVEQLDSMMNMVGELVIVAAQERTATARVIYSADAIMNGDRVELK